MFQKQQLSPWNYAIFYVDPLEIHPSPPFTVTGWVHTNYNLYTAHNTLTFADKVTYASDWFVNFMPGDNTQFGVELIQPIAMDEGLRFAVREGGRTVGAGVVTKVIK